jgi:ElaB/YqjD/DUF883 family membrane-anchored ribosome-binding protein
MQEQHPGIGTTPGEKRGEFSDRVAERGHSAVDSVAGRVAEAERKLGETRHKVEDRARAASHHARDSVSEYQTQAEQYAREHPFAALGIAFAAGVIVSHLMRR